MCLLSFGSSANFSLSVGWWWAGPVLLYLGPLASPPYGIRSSSRLFQAYSNGGDGRVPGEKVEVHKVS